MQSNNIKYIVGLVGKKRTGKDLFYLSCLELYLEKRIGLPPKRFAFADSLKQEVAKTAGISMEELNARKTEFRGILQDVGNERRKHDEDYWIGRVAFKMINFDREMFGQLHIPHIAIITDVRFLNEAVWIQSLGGKLVRVLRSDLEEDTEDKHISETELTKIHCDISVTNEGLKRARLYKMQVLDTIKQLGYDN